MANLSFDKDKTKTRKCELRKMYEKFYCTSDNKCRYYGECSQGMNTECGYDSTYAAKVANNYDIKFDGKDIRILFVGKECPNKNEVFCPPARLSDFTGKGGVNGHYRETFKMLKKLLNYNPPDIRPYRDQNDHILQAFALTNAYRCAFKTNQNQRCRISNNDTQKKNCLKILKEELKTLEPTVVVIQTKAVDPHWLYLDAEETECEQLFYSDEKKCYIIWCDYPTTAKWNKQGRYGFEKIVGVLQNKGIIPKCDMTSAFDEEISDEL